MELEQAVLDQQEELLTLTNWRNLIGIVPIVNVANELLTPEEERFEPFRDKAIRENEMFG